MFACALDKQMWKCKKTQKHTTVYADCKTSQFSLYCKESNQSNLVFMFTHSLAWPQIINMNTHVYKSDMWADIVKKKPHKRLETRLTICCKCSFPKITNYPSWCFIGQSVTLPNCFHCILHWRSPNFKDDFPEINTIKLPKSLEKNNGIWNMLGGPKFHCCGVSNLKHGRISCLHKTKREIVGFSDHECF